MQPITVTQVGSGYYLLKIAKYVETKFKIPEKRKISEPNRPLFNISDKINLRRSGKYVAVTNLSMNYTCKNITKLYKNNKLKISGPSWNENCELPDG